MPQLGQLLDVVLWRLLSDLGWAGRGHSVAWQRRLLRTPLTRVIGVAHVAAGPFRELLLLRLEGFPSALLKRLNHAVEEEVPLRRLEDFGRHDTIDVVADARVK